MDNLYGRLGALFLLMTFAYLVIFSLVQDTAKNVSYASHNWTVSEMIRRSNGAVFMPLALSAGFLISLGFVLEDCSKKLYVNAAIINFIGFIFIALLKHDFLVTPVEADLASSDKYKRLQSLRRALRHGVVTAGGIACIGYAMLSGRQNPRSITIAFWAVLAGMCFTIIGAGIHGVIKKGVSSNALAGEESLIKNYMNLFALFEYSLVCVILFGQFAPTGAPRRPILAHRISRSRKHKTDRRPKRSLKA